MSGNAISKFLTELALHFPPKHARPELENAWLKSMAEALKGYSPTILDRAARKIINKRKYTSFPLPAECKAACIEASDDIEREERARTLPEMRPALFAEWSDERERFADDLLKTGLGKQAGRDGWGLAFWNFARRNLRAPKDYEIEQCKRIAREFDEAYKLAIRTQGSLGPLGRMLVTLGDAMLEDREKIRAEALGQ